METETSLVIVTWAGLAALLIGIGLHKTRKLEAQRSLIFQPGHEEYTKMYVGAIAAVEAEMDAWVKK